MGQLEDMQAFVRVVEAGSLSRAADQLGVAKSAVSRRLGDLERRLGTTLLNRTTRRSSLTEAGRLFYERSSRIIDDVAEMNAMTASNEALLSGTLHLSAPLSFGLEHLTPALDEFTHRYPDLTLHVDFSDRQIDLVEEGFDLAFRIAELRDSNLKARRITPIRLLLCASPDYLRAHGVPESHADLLHHQALLYDHSGSAFPWRLVGPDGSLHKLKPGSKVIANNGGFLRDMAIAGHGILLSPTFITWEALARKELVPVLPGYTSPALHAYAVYPQTRYLSQRARLLIDFLVERFGQNPYWDQYI
jgi:DNA-binding transcriptional LysR family regulator